MTQAKPKKPESGASKMFLNRELSWLHFARRVLAQVEDEQVPLLERVKFVGIMGMLHDEFFMKRMSGLKRLIAKNSRKRSLDGKLPREEFDSCRKELLRQERRLARIVQEDLRPTLQREGMPIRDHETLKPSWKKALREYARRSVVPILTPLAVDAEHPFPFISNAGINLAVLFGDRRSRRERFVRVKVPDNRPRWVPLPKSAGFVPLEQVIAANLDLVFPGAKPKEAHFFRVTRGAEGDLERADPGNEPEEGTNPGSIVRQVSNELKARRFAGVVRLQVAPSMPKKVARWLAQQLEVAREDIYSGDPLLRLSDFASFSAPGRDDLRYPRHRPVTHPRLRRLDPADPTAIFHEIRHGDILLHHPYQRFDTSVLRFLESAALDPAVLAIKLTIYRTSSDSPIVRALVDAARRGKQVAVLVEITARFDEAPNIAWGRLLEREGVHVSYGVEKLKTHVKLALVLREEEGEIRRYAHVGTGNYHAGTARVYEDIGLLTSHPAVCEDVAAVFNMLTGATGRRRYRTMLVAPQNMRKRFVELIGREARNARAGQPSGIRAKMNQLQDPEIIRELYRASRVGVPVTLNVRGLCCLRPKVPGLSENIRVFGVVGRFLEHSRIYEFANGGEPEYFLGSADWMRRNLSRRVETVVPVLDEVVRRQLCAILDIYEEDNCSAWDCDATGAYTRRKPAPGQGDHSAQETLVRFWQNEGEWGRST